MRHLQGFNLFATGLTVVTAIALVACGSNADGPLEANDNASANGDAGANVKGAAEQGTFGTLPSDTTEERTSPYDKQGQACSGDGQTQKCFVGDPAKAGIGSCTWGKQTCIQNHEFAQWGPCEGSGAPTPAACDGTDHLCDGHPEASCSCTPGQTMECYTGPKGTENVGLCHAGKQTCNEDGKGWGPCKGEVKPTAEVCTDKLDHSCNGAAGCADGQCTNTSACKSTPANTEARKTYCNAAGTFQVSGVRFRLASLLPPTVCSGQGSQCGSLTTGGTFTANCAGTYRVCARVPTTQGCEVASNMCVSVNVPTDGATVSLPPMSGFGPVGGSCVANCFTYRGQLSVSLDVTGQTKEGIAVSKTNAASAINPTYCTLGGDNGGGGSGNF